MRSGRRALAVGALATALAIAGCDEGTGRLDGGAALARIHPAFGPASGAMDFGAIPFPDDLYLNADGRVEVGRLPSEERALPEYAAAQREALLELDGFSPNASIFFYFPPDSLDPSSLPGDPNASLLDESAVFLVDADPASPDAFRRVPVRTHWDAAEGLLALRPFDGHPLVGGRRYAAVVTTGVRDDTGEPIGPGERFRAIRDALTAPEDPVDREAYDEYAPVLSSLASNGAPRDRIAGLAVFTVQTIAQDLEDARALVWEGPAPVVTLDAAVAAGEPLDTLLGIPAVNEPGLDGLGGVAHRSIGWLIHGHFSSPWLMSATVDVHGHFDRGADGALVSEGTDEVPFTLTLPVGAGPDVPLVIFQHGLGSERSTMLSLADALAASGFAVLAIDIPFHGGRALGPGENDIRHNYGGGAGPDGFGDRVGLDVYMSYLGVLDSDGPFPPFHPTYIRDALRQSVVDLMSAVRIVREGDQGSIQALPGLETLSFATTPLAFVGVSLGGIVGSVFVASEPEIGAAVLNVTGGDLVRLVERSPTFSELFFPLLTPQLGLTTATLTPDYPPSLHPELTIFQTLLDRGDSISFAPLLARRPTHLLFQMALHDETLPNSATEALARAVGAPIVDADPSHTDLASAASPVSENVEVDSTRFTRGLTVFDPASHGLLSRHMDEREFATPPEPPFTAIDPLPIDNPVVAAVDQAVHFLDSWRSGSTEVRAPAP